MSPSKVKRNERYWNNICEIEKRQTQKGIETYGQILECNQDPDWETRIEYFEEELVDALKYAEWIKDKKRQLYQQGRADERLRIINLISEYAEKEVDCEGCRECMCNLIELIGYGEFDD